MKLTNILLFLVLGAFGISCAFAQDTTSDSKGKAATRTITGCLAKGDSAKEFDLKANNGSTWELKSDQVALFGFGKAALLEVIQVVPTVPVEGIGNHRSAEQVANLAAGHPRL